MMYSMCMLRGPTSLKNKINDYYSALSEKKKLFSTYEFPTLPFCIIEGVKFHAVVMAVETKLTTVLFFSQMKCCVISDLIIQI